MKILLITSALLAAALTAIAIPEMKKLLLLIPFALLALTFSGCTSVTKGLRNLPDGHFENLAMNETGKFTSTTGTFAVLDKDGDVINARGVDLRHTNPWMPNVSLKADSAVIDISTSARKRANPAPIAAPKL